MFQTSPEHVLQVQGFRAAAQEEAKSKLPEVPDLGQQQREEVLTRGNQFRMKADRKLKKQEKKQQKAAEKKQKQSEREAKKTEKQQKEGAKAEKKKDRDAKKAKNGKKKDKEGPKRKRGCCQAEPEEKDEEGAINSEEPVANQSDQAQTEQVEEQTAQHGNDEREPRTDEVDEEMDGATFVDAGPIALSKHAVPPTSPRRGSKRWKLRMLKSHDNLTGCCSMQRKRKVEKNTNMQQHQQHEHAKSTSKKKDGARTKKNKGTKDIQVSSVKKPPTESKSAKGKKKPKGEPVKEAVDLITGVLKTCEKSECTHPDWENFQIQYDPKVFSLSIYWSRMAVGVKMASHIVDKLKGKKAKNMSKVKGQGKGKGKWRQIAYFSCPTDCYYSNVALAYEYAPRNHWMSNFDVISV